VRQRNLPLLLIVVALALSARGDELRWNGFVLGRGASNSDEAPFYDSPVSSQLQMGLDWEPSLLFGAHVHLLARSDPRGSERGAVGVVQAYLDANVPHGVDNNLRIRAGAFFLPTSHENTDPLWASPYAISSSALNSWMGEEFRPVGVDLQWSARRVVHLGATVYRGNETFGAFPIDRGWAIRDHWALLGERLEVDDEHDASVSAENDGRLGWAARAGWNNDLASVTFTRIDNRADGREYGHLLNWDTDFNVAAADLVVGDWTVAGEAGWGITRLDVGGTMFGTGIGAAYALVSRKLGPARATLRQEWFYVDDVREQATTAAFLWSVEGGWRPGLEVSTSGGTTRVLVELRKHFNR
jgi:hypothetical protein